MVDDRPTRAIKERIDSERNQGRAPDMDWLDHDRLGFNYRLSDVACALGLAQLERLDRDLLVGASTRRRARTARRSPGSKALSCRAPTPAALAAAGSCSSSSCRGASTATRRSGAAERWDPEQAVLPGRSPDELLPRAVRPSGGRVPGLRGRRGAIDRAAVLPGDERGAGRAGRATRCGAVLAP